MTNNYSRIVVSVGAVLTGSAWYVGRSLDAHIEKHGVASLGRVSHAAYGACNRLFDVGVAMMAADSPRGIATSYVARRQMTRSEA